MEDKPYWFISDYNIITIYEENPGNEVLCFIEDFSEDELDNYHIDSPDSSSFDEISEATDWY